MERLRQDAGEAMSFTFSIADHTVTRRIGVGAYGEVWLARSVMGIERAVKVVRRDRFESGKSYDREFSGVKKFEPISRTHDGLVDILQVGRDDGAGFFYYVMELADDAGGVAEGSVEGEYRPLTLQERIRQSGRLPVAECVRIGETVAGALEFVHSKGLVHRDVKPSNIVYVGGRPKLADVGLVASLGDAKSFVGTEGYIAPEGPGTPVSDIYSLGKVLYEMATGKSRLDFPEIPEDLRIGEDGGAFAELNEVVLRACAADPELRYGGAGEVRSELLLLNAGRSVRQLRRNEWLMSIWRRIGVTALVLVLLVASALFFERKRGETTRLAMEAEARTRRAIAERETVARQNLYAADMNLAQQSLDDGNYGRAEALLSGYVSPAGSSDVRGIEWFHFWHRLRGDSVAVFRGHTDVVSSLLLSPDGERLYSAGFDSTIREWSLAERREMRRWERPGSLFMALAVDRGGTRFAGEGGNRSYSSLLDITTGLWVTNVTSASPSIAFAPDGTQIVRGAKTMLFETNGVVEITDLAFRVQRVLPESGGRVAFSRDGHFLATGAWEGAVRLWSWPALELEGVLDGAGTVLGMSFSPSGERLATVSREGDLSIWDVRSRRRALGKVAHGGALIWSVAYSPDGKRLATGGNDQTVRTWNADTLEEQHVYRGHGGEVWAVIWSRDGDKLLSAGKDATIRMWTGDPPSRGVEIAGVVQAAVFSQDERLFAVRMSGGRGMVVETGTGREVMQIEALGELGGFSSDGGTIGILTEDWVYERRSVTSAVRVLERKVLAPVEGSRSRRLLSQQGRWLATGMTEGEVYVHDLRGGGDSFVLPGHSEMVVSLAISPDERFLVSGALDRTAKLWDLEARTLLHSFEGHGMGVGSVNFSTDGKILATGSWDDSVRIWDVERRVRLAQLGGHHAGVQAVALSPDDRTVVTMNGQSVLTYWSLAAQREAGMIQLPGGTRQCWVTVSPAGHWIAAVSQAEVLTLVPAPRVVGVNSR